MDRLGRLVGVLLIALGVAITPAGVRAAEWPPQVPPAKAPKVVSQAPCPASVFTCVTIEVALDHFASGGRAVEVTFALHEATARTRKGVFVIATGGPGSSGIDAADRYLALFDREIVRDFDLVFFDQRGVGRSMPFDCPDASLAFYTAGDVPTLDAASALAYARDARTYAAACVAESGIDPARLRLLATRQSVEDLEAFRIWLKADRLDLYGESYGTQYAQTYAAAHPNRLRSLILDGPVDLSLTGPEFYAEDVDAVGDVLEQTLEACTGETACRADVIGRNALAGFDRLVARLRLGPLPYAFVDRAGLVRRRSFALHDLETAVASSLDDAAGQMQLQRALGWASRGRMAPLARLAYLDLGQDAQTLGAIDGRRSSDAAYFAIECMDADYGPGSDERRADAYLRAGDEAKVSSRRMGSVFYGDLPCAYWPAHPSSGSRPNPLTATSFPVFILASTTDPATPYAGALRVMRRLDDGYLFVQPGGPHVILGRGQACPDDAVTAFLEEGTLPSTRFVTCEAKRRDAYVPIPAARARDYRDTLAAMRAVDDEINHAAEFRRWDGAAPLAFGCLFGGTIRYTADRTVRRVALEDCAFSEDLPLTGTATIDWSRSTFTMAVSGPGATKLDYRRDAKGQRSVRGALVLPSASPRGGGPPAVSGRVVSPSSHGK
ncbi:MAG: alpha/beta hydrolase [Chloroflexota bacterium]